MFVERIKLVSLRKKDSHGVFLKEEAEVRFWRAICKREDGCWEWMGSRHYKGYGEFTPKPGNRMKAHRYAWISTRGPIPDGLLVCHHCDNPPCCNPDHLFLGSEKANKNDSVEKRRHAFGCKCGRSKLTEADVLEIRRLDKLCNTSRMSIARRFKISGRMVTAICVYENWKHVA